MTLTTNVFLQTITSTRAHGTNSHHILVNFMRERVILIKPDSNKIYVFASSYHWFTGLSLDKT